MCSVMHFNPLAPVMAIFTIILAQSLSQFSGKFWGEVGEFGGESSPPPPPSG